MTHARYSVGAPLPPPYLWSRETPGREVAKQLLLAAMRDRYREDENPSIREHLTAAGTALAAWSCDSEVWDHTDGMFTARISDRFAG